MQHTLLFMMKGLRFCDVERILNVEECRRWVRIYDYDNGQLLPVFQFHGRSYGLLQVTVHDMWWRQDYDLVAAIFPGTCSS